MKVLLLNGSPNKKGCTYTALEEVAVEIRNNNIETEIYHVGKKHVQGCIACGSCRKKKKCVFDDGVNELLERINEIDAFVFGSPVYYAAATGHIVSFLNRLFFASNGRFWGKVGSSVVSCRRGGAATTFDQLNKYLTLSSMVVASSTYWNQVHGNTPEEVKKDIEGMQTMRILGANIAWLLMSVEAGKKAGIIMPKPEQRIYTNFIRE